MGRKDVALAADKAAALKKLLQEAGAAIYAQSPQAPKTGPYAETRTAEGFGATGGEARPSGAGPRGRVVDAEYQEDR